MSFNHLILCCPLLLPSIFPSIRVFSNESVLYIRWPEYWSFSFDISPSNEYSGLISFRIGWFDLLAVQGTLKNLLQHCLFFPITISSVQLLSHVRLFATPWTKARQASLSITNSWSLLKLMSIESVMPSNHLILCCPLLLMPPVPPSIRFFSNESTLCMRWPKIGVSALASFPPKKSQGSSSEWTGWISLQSKGLSRVFSNTTVQKRQFFGAQLSSQSKSRIHT